ncbi:hypothetical protein U1Q18_039694 [Sarracenia purpurea var. burkii]
MYKKPISTADIDRPIHSETVTAKSKGKNPPKDVKPFEDICFSNGLKEGAIGESSKGWVKQKVELRVAQSRLENGRMVNMRGINLRIV